VRTTPEAHGGFPVFVVDFTVDIMAARYRVTGQSRQRLLESLESSTRLQLEPGLRDKLTHGLSQSF
jgi:hypothetical protein